MSDTTLHWVGTVLLAIVGYLYKADRDRQERENARRLDKLEVDRDALRDRLHNAEVAATASSATVAGLAKSIGDMRTEIRLELGNLHKDVRALLGLRADNDTPAHGLPATRD